MNDRQTASASRARLFAGAVWLLGLVAVAAQAGALATQYFQPSLNADYLYPERFAAGVLSGAYPLSGCVHSPAPYFFPDMTVGVVLLALLHGAPMLPYYAVGAFVGLAVVAGWSLARAGGVGGSGWVGGAVLVNLLLATRGLADHQLYLWWLGTAGFHGAAVVMGLAQFALWAGPAGEALPRGRWWTAAVLLALGLASDTLLLTQFVGPLLVAMVIVAGRDWRDSPRLRSFVLALACAVAAVVVFRVACALTGFGTFARLARYAPTPGAMAGAAEQLGRDVTGAIWTRAPLLVVLAAVGSAALAYRGWRARRGDTVPEPVRQARWFAAAVIVSTVLVPVVTAYWRSQFNARHLLPLLVVPLWGCFAARRSAWRPVAIASAGFIFLLAAGWGLHGISLDRWQWPYPDDVAALDRELATGGPPRGLADYWHAQRITALSRAGVRLNQLRPDGRTYFWNNNAFAHYDVAADGTLRPAHYDFVIVDGLDTAALEKKFGEPSRCATVGGMTVWFYEGAAATRMNGLVDAEVRSFLGARPGTERIAAEAR